MLKFYVKVFYVMGKALSGKLSCPCDRSCINLLIPLSVKWLVYTRLLLEVNATFQSGAIFGKRFAQIVTQLLIKGKLVREVYC